MAVSANVFITGLMARRLGGGRLAMVLAAVAAILAPDYLLMGSFFSTNAFELLIWTGIVYLAIKMVQEKSLDGGWRSDCCSVWDLRQNILS